MAIFEGSLAEFNTYVGPRARNVVQYITRNMRNCPCEECGREGARIEAAHVHGEERPAIIARILQENFATETENHYRVDLSEFFRLFNDAHFPIENHIRFLCTACHRAYDNQATVAVDPVQQAEAERVVRQAGDKPEIELIPNDINEFKRRLLESGEAQRTWCYVGGTEETETWDASKMNENSNILSNIRTNNKYRDWRNRGIVRVRIEVV